MKRNEDSFPQTRAAAKQKNFLLFWFKSLSLGKKKINKKLSLSLSMNRLFLRFQNEKEELFTCFTQSRKSRKKQKFV